MRVSLGSRAKGKFAKYSDIDLAIDAGKKVEESRVFEAKNMLNESNIPYEIDIVDLYQDERLKSIILRDGILWKM